MNAPARRRKFARYKILKAAFVTFSRDGFHAARMDDIARRSGLSKGAVYFHFSSKQRLFLALLARQEKRFFTRLERAMAAAGPSHRKRLQAALTTGLDYIERHRRLARIVFHALLLGEPFDAWLEGFYGRLVGLVQAEITQAAGRATEKTHGDPELLARLWVGALGGLVVHLVFRDAVRYSGRSEEIQRLLLRTLEPSLREQSENGTQST